MSPNKTKGKVRNERKKMISMEIKREIIEKYEKGVRVSELARQYGRTTSTISTLLKQKEVIKAVTPAVGVTLMSKLRTSIHDEMERLLLVWMKEKQLNRDNLTQSIIREKALAIFSDLLKRTPGTSTGEAPEDSFKASRGWFDNFKKRAGIHSVRYSEMASSDGKTVEDYLQTFSKVIKAKGYVAQQVFNCDETGLFWKRIPKRHFSTTEKTIPGHNSKRDRLTLALCANASGDCRIKPLLVYHSENPKAFKSHNISKDELQVMWRANPKAWVTRQFFVEWVNLVLGPSVKKYLEECHLPLQALLVLDNAPAHPPNLEDNILKEFRFIRVLFLEPNTTAILQPMRQQVISDFKKLYTKYLFQRCLEVTESTNFTLREYWNDHFNIVICIRIIHQAWLGVTRRTLTSAWKKLWPEAVVGRSVEEFEAEVQVEKEIVYLGKSLGLEIDENDVTELVEERSQELTTEDLQELESQQHAEVLQSICFEETKMVDSISTSELEDVLEMWEKILKFVEETYPDKYVAGRATDFFNDTCIRYYRNILKERKKQALDRIFLKRPMGENEERKKAKKTK